MLFPAVLINFSNSKVCLIGEWSIGWDAPEIMKVSWQSAGPFVVECVSVVKEDPFTFELIVPSSNGRLTKSMMEFTPNL